MYLAMKELCIEQDPETPLSASDLDLVKDIKQAFWDRPYPGDDHIRGTAPIWEDLERLTDWIGKKWQDIPLSVVATYRDYTSFFSTEGFSYYLPTFMISVICHPSTVDTLVDSLEYRLTPDENAVYQQKLVRIALGLSVVEAKVVLRYLERSLWAAQIGTDPWKAIQFWKDQVEEKTWMSAEKDPLGPLMPKAAPALSKSDVAWKKKELSESDRELMLTFAEKQLLLDIETAFDGKKEAEDLYFVPHAERAGWKEWRAQFSGLSWQEVTAEIILSDRYGFRLMTPLGFAYYLPAWMRASIKEWDLLDGVDSALEMQLSPRDKRGGGNDAYEEIIPCLSKKQRELLVRYFAYFAYKARDKDRRSSVIKLWLSLL